MDQDDKGPGSRWDRGRRMAATIVGAGKRGARMDSDLYDLIIRYAFGTVWDRPGLDVDTRRLITLAMTLAGGHHPEFKLHFRYAVDAGVPRETLKELMLHSAVYCGIPASLTAFRLAEEVYAEVDSGN